MSDENEDEEPVVELGDKKAVEGAPLARIADRIHWPLQKSEIVRRYGEETIRTSSGPQSLEAILEDIDISYFEHKDEFVTACREEIGYGPVPTEK